MLKWYFTMPSPLTIRPPVLLAFLAAAFFSAAPRVSADTAPDWLRAAAQEKLPDYDKETNAVILLDETQTTVRDNGEIDTLHRGAIRILREDGKREYGGIAVNFDKETKISYLKAWTIESNGRELAVGDKDSFERGYLSDIEYNDAKVKALPYPEGNPGNVVGYEYVQRQRPEILEDIWFFQRRVPVHRSRFTLQLPSGWEFTVRWGNHAEQQPQSTGQNSYTWEINDSPAIEIEPDMPPWSVVEGHMVVKYFPHDPKLRSKTSGSWNDIALWYQNLITPRRVATPEIKVKVAELTAGIQDPLEKIRALAGFTQRQIRYQAVEIGIGGHQPHAAGDVFAHRFGDCKDKATLLNTMLQEIGIESYNVMISPERGRVRPDFPLLDFGHSIVAIHLPDSIPDEGLHAVIHDPELGRLLFFDATDEYLPVGYLPSILQGTEALVVTPRGGKLVHIPLSAPSTNRLLRTAQFSLSATGDLSGQIHEIEWGGPAAEERAAFIETPPAKRAEVFDRFLGNFLNNYHLAGATLGNLDQYDLNFSMDYKFVSAGYANSAGDLLFVRPRVVGDKYTGVLRLFAEHKPRKYPIEFDETTLQDDVVRHYPALRLRRRRAAKTGTGGLRIRQLQERNKSGGWSLALQANVRNQGRDGADRKAAGDSRFSAAGRGGPTVIRGPAQSRTLSSLASFRQASRNTVRTGSGFSAEAFADLVAEDFAVHVFSFEAGLGGFHHRTHLLQRIGAFGGDGVFDGAMNFLVARRYGQILLDDGDFLRFFVGEILAAAARELIDGFAALLHQRL